MPWNAPFTCMGSSQLLAVNAKYKLTAVKENKGLFAYNDVFGIYFSADKHYE